MMTYEEVVAAIQQFPASEKARLLEDISMALRRDLARSTSASHPSLYGSFADLGSAPSAEEIDEARHEMWANFPREDI